MKPIYLSMQAFGPFASIQTIDFQSLGDNPLFLINGPTGAGKSTILDAISFALYGESTGKERDPTTMRCDLSDTDTPTEVIFDFNLSGNVYRIIRTPAQELTKKKGVGTTSKGPTAIVYRHKNANIVKYIFDETASDVELLPLKGVKEVNEWVKDLTGLSSEQFRQVMVLPQGQFRKLLLADSDQRENIFSQLFQTNIYKQIEEHLKLKSAKLRSTRKSLTENVVGLLDSVELAEVSELVEKLAQIEPIYKQAKDLHEVSQKKALEAVKALQIAQVTADKFAELATLEIKITQLQERNAEMSQRQKDIERSERAGKIRPIQLQLKAAQDRLTAEIDQKEGIDKQLERLLEDKAKESKRFNEIEPKWLGLDSKKQELNNWQRKKLLLVGLNDEQRKYKSLSESLSQAEEKIQQQISIKEKTNQEFVNISEQIKINNESLAHMPRLQSEFEKYDRLGRIRGNVAELESTINSLTIEAQQVSGQLAKLDDQKKTDQIKLKEVELSWHQGQAFELSKQLKVGEPCFVCGSTDHPRPANADNVIYADKNQVNQARAQVQATQEAFNKTETQLNAMKFKITETNQRVLELTKELGEHHDQSIDWFRQQWKQCKSQIGDLDVLKKSQSEYLNNQQICSEQVHSIDALIVELVAKRDTIKIEQSACLARIQEREQEIPSEYREVKSLDEKISLLNKFITDVTEAYQRHSTQLQQIEQQLTAQQSLLKNVVDRIDLQSKQVDQLLVQWHEALTTSGFDSVDEYTSASWTDDYMSEQKLIIETHKTTTAEYKTRENYIRSELKSTIKPDLAALQEQVLRTEESQLETAEQLSRLANEFESLKRVSRRLNKIQQQVDQVESEYKVIGTLADVASGQTGNRVSLQRFVLGVLLDDVLNEASQRLQLMSKGRYRLIRKLDRSKGNKTSGLELEIEDAYSGGRRPANTLSGGESFMAALSLALGLSDVVQSYSGGIKLETLFIDEGFGSLDMESLDLAIQTLIDLRKSGRTIGIISHVSELKEQMSQRIDVIPSDRGSVVSVVHQ